MAIEDKVKLERLGNAWVIRNQIIGYHGLQVPADDSVQRKYSYMQDLIKMHEAESIWLREIILAIGWNSTIYYQFGIHGSYTVNGEEFTR